MQVSCKLIAPKPIKSNTASHFRSVKPKSMGALTKNNLNFELYLNPWSESTSKTDKSREDSCTLTRPDIKADLFNRDSTETDFTGESLENELDSLKAQSEILSIVHQSTNLLENEWDDCGSVPLKKVPNSNKNINRARPCNPFLKNFFNEIDDNNTAESGNKDELTVGYASRPQIN